jgi:hypothetical protein
VTVLLRGWRALTTLRQRILHVALSGGRLIEWPRRLEYSALNGADGEVKLGPCASLVAVALGEAGVHGVRVEDQGPPRHVAVFSLHPRVTLAFCCEVKGQLSGAAYCVYPKNSNETNE